MSARDPRGVNEIIDVLYVLLDQLAKRLDPNDAVAIFNEHGFKASSGDELRRLLNGLRPHLTN
jgi:hypothetical protein